MSCLSTQTPSGLCLYVVGVLVCTQVVCYKYKNKNVFVFRCLCTDGEFRTSCLCTGV